MLLISCLLVPLLMLFPNHIGFWHIDAMAIVVLVLGFFLLMVVTLAIRGGDSRERFRGADDGAGGGWLAGGMAAIPGDCARPCFRIRDLFP